MITSRHAKERRSRRPLFAAAWVALLAASIAAPGSAADDPSPRSLPQGVTNTSASSDQTSRQTSPGASTSQSQNDLGSLAVSVSPGNGLLSQLYTLTIEVKSDEGVKVTIPDFPPRIGEFRVRNSERSLPRVEGKEEIRTLTATLEPLSTGTLEIDPIPIELQLPGVPEGTKPQYLESKRLTVSVQSSIDSKDVSLDQLARNSDVITVAASRLWLIVAAIALVTILVGGGLLYWSRQPKLPPEPVLSPKQRALRELDQLQSSGLARVQVKQFFVELTGIVRRFIEAEVGIHAPEQTTEEFLRVVERRSPFPQPVARSLKTFLESADLVKFAGYKPSEEAINTSIDSGRAFVLELAKEESQVVA